MRNNSSQFQSRIPVYDADDISPCRYHLIKRAGDPGSSDIMPGLPGRWKLDSDSSGLPQQAAMLQTTSELTYLWNLYTFLQGFIIFILSLSGIRLIGVQPRLSVIPGSLWLMIPEVLHLLVVVLIVICCLSVSMVVVMGATVGVVSTFQGALMLMANILVTGDELQVFDNINTGQYDYFVLAVINTTHVLLLFLLLALQGMLLTIIIAPFSLLVHRGRKHPSVVEDVESLVQWSVQQVRGQAWSNGFLIEKIQGTLKKARKPIFGKMKQYLSARLSMAGGYIRSSLRFNEDHQSIRSSDTLKGVLNRSAEIKRGMAYDATLSLQEKAFARALIEAEERGSSRFSPSRPSKNRGKPLSLSPSPAPATLHEQPASPSSAGSSFTGTSAEAAVPASVYILLEEEGSNGLDVRQVELVDLVRSNLDARGLYPSIVMRPMSSLLSPLCSQRQTMKAAGPISSVAGPQRAPLPPSHPKSTPQSILHLITQSFPPSPAPATLHEQPASPSSAGSSFTGTSAEAAVPASVYILLEEEGSNGLDVRQVELVDLVRSNLDARGLYPSIVMRPMSSLLSPLCSQRQTMKAAGPISSVAGPQRAPLPPSHPKSTPQPILHLITQSLDSIDRGKTNLYGLASEMARMEETLKLAEAFIKRRKDRKYNLS